MHPFFNKVSDETALNCAAGAGKALPMPRVERHSTGIHCQGPISSRQNPESGIYSEFFPPRQFLCLLVKFAAKLIASGTPSGRAVFPIRSKSLSRLPILQVRLITIFSIDN